MDGKNHPSPPGRRETAESGVREGDQVSTTTTPTRTDRYSGAEESEVREGDQVTNPSPPTRKDIETGAAVSRVGVARGKQTNQAELLRTDSRERRKMRCQST